MDKIDPLYLFTYTEREEERRLRADDPVTYVTRRKWIDLDKVFAVDEMADARTHILRIAIHGQFANGPLNLVGHMHDFDAQHRVIPSSFAQAFDKFITTLDAYKKQ